MSTNHINDSQRSSQGFILISKKNQNKKLQLGDYRHLPDYGVMESHFLGGALYIVLELGVGSEQVLDYVAYPPHGWVPVERGQLLF